MNALFKPELVRIVDAFKSKGDCLDYMAGLLSDSGCLSFPDRYLNAVKGREEIMSTGIGRGIAIPHARDLTVNCLKIAVCMLEEALDFGAVDNEPVNLIFMIAVPQNSNQEYMLILRSLSEYLRQDKNRAKLLGSNSDQELFEHVQAMQDTINAAAAK
ncbi:MAG: PTS sugar transporter subunit IIA [Candidatus Cloacimonadaceae bacterium]|jgi:mannitol/fructose-specific phosphotransferase system IIA component (Ntr-type)|nr:PTS sugar transporter subunit IIA [Candidatus Cloacimonadota bacterium]MDY0127620.1 PTS sugar transporter subunit IIA [Candidatus Cloacimonadaceae bacterium]MCB5254951.1 PTS sugar transporter subunit IIA [Candidatus Cloacimonadota bacterium]MCK9178051.1 PTS sugar transporter subunit IIA [Candidatus Cloacimonadota bacterium]MCK9242444.1 PTS sugar transporter subunit IIA [Candidatus Cloacimonadota bacterium]